MTWKPPIRPQELTQPARDAALLADNSPEFPHVDSDTGLAPQSPEGGKSSDPVDLPARDGLSFVRELEQRIRVLERSRDFEAFIGLMNRLGTLEMAHAGTQKLVRTLLGPPPTYSATLYGTKSQEEVAEPDPLVECVSHLLAMWVAWGTFERGLPDGLYDGIGAMRLAVSGAKAFLSRNGAIT